MYIIYIYNIYIYIYIYILVYLLIREPIPQHLLLKLLLRDPYIFRPPVLHTKRTASCRKLKYVSNEMM